MKNKKYLIGILFIVTAFLFTIVNVNAKGLMTSGDTVTQEGKYNSVRFAFGSDVTNKADVDGLSFVAGQKVNLQGKAPYGFYAGNSVDVSENITQDAFVAAKTITLTDKALVGRDAFLAASSIKVNAVIGRDLRAGAETIDLRGATINGDAYISAEKLILDNDTKILGKLSYSEDTKVIGLNKDNIKNVKITKSLKAKEKDKMTIAMERIKSLIYSIARAFIVMLVLLWLLPKLDKKLKDEKVNASEIAKKSLVGLGVLFIVPIIALIALFTGLLTSLSLITFAVYGVALYIGSIFVYYIVGNCLDKKFIKKENKYLSLLCGIVVVKIVSLIPIIGGLVSLIVFLYGLGLVFNYINSIRKNS